MSSDVTHPARLLRDDHYLIFFGMDLAHGIIDRSLRELVCDHWHWEVGSQCVGAETGGNDELYILSADATPFVYVSTKCSTYKFRCLRGLLEQRCSLLIEADRRESIDPKMLLELLDLHASDLTKLLEDSSIGNHDIQVIDTMLTAQVFHELLWRGEGGGVILGDHDLASARHRQRLELFGRPGAWPITDRGNGDGVRTLSIRSQQSFADTTFGAGDDDVGCRKHCR
jgi:hypothetical protein